MTIDITALDQLPESDPIALAGLDQLGLRPCYSVTCTGTCWFTCLVTES